MGLEKTITFSVPVITPKNEVYPDEAEELFAEAQKMVQIRYKSTFARRKRTGRTNPDPHL